VHIPDGYLSPATCATAYVVAVPMWMIASRRVSDVVKTRNVPMLAVFSALSFLVMMFNIPVPDGTTAHAVGAVIIAICLGPWAAVLAVSVALLFQALLFGDGGVLAYGANTVNMAVLMPFVAYGVYRLVAGRSPLTSRRRVVAAGIAGYVGINVAALATAIEFGIQPALATTAAGVPLYSPYDVSEAVTAMALAHLTIAGACEAILTAGVLAYLQRTDVARLVPSHPGVPLTAADTQPRTGRLRPGLVAVASMAVMVLMTPLGLLAPGGAFGEDAPEDLDLSQQGLSAVPSGLEKYNGFWSNTLLDGYGFGGDDNASLGYVVSAAVGVLVVGAAIYVATRLLAAVRAGSGSRSDRADADNEPARA
jgi:cobalt/nickel transport system permease protein